MTVTSVKMTAFLTTMSRSYRRYLKTATPQAAGIPNSTIHRSSMNAAFSRMVPTSEEGVSPKMALITNTRTNATPAAIPT